MNSTDQPRPFLGLITALESETKAFGGGKPTPQGHFQRREFDCAQGRVVCLQCGPGPERSLAAARELVAEGAGALLCAGVAGGIDAQSECGELLLSEDVQLVHEGTPLAVPQERPGLAEAALLLLAGSRLRFRAGIMLTTATPLLDLSERERWHTLTGASAVDTESAGVALAAMEARIPFLAARAVCDSIKRPVSKAMLAACDNGAAGSMRGLVRAILRRPSLLGDFWRAGRDYSKALDTLRNARKALFQACFEAMTDPDSERSEADALNAPGPEEPIQ
jgi:nucleoside phosphorylase